MTQRGTPFVFVLILAMASPLSWAATPQPLVNETFAGSLNRSDWKLAPGVEVTDAGLSIPSGLAAEATDLTTEGPIAIHFKGKLTAEAPDCHLGVQFGPKHEPHRYRLIVYPNGHMFLADQKLKKPIFRALSYLDPIAGFVEVTLRIYPKGRRLTYDCDGAFYGERILFDDEMPELSPLTGFALLSHAAGSRWTAFRVEPLPEDTPAPLYTATQSAEPKLPVWPKTAAVAENLLFLEAEDLSPDEAFLATCLQGLLNRYEARVYLGYRRYVQIDTGEDWSRLLIERGHAIERLADLDAFVERFRGEISRVVVYDPRAWQPAEHPVINHQINIATTAAGMLNAVPVTPALKARFFPNTPVAVDLRDRWNNARDAYRWAWNLFWPHANREIIAHLEGAPYANPVRDYLVANRVFTFLSSDVRNEADYRFYTDMLAATPANTPIIGMTVLQYGARSPEAVFDEDALFRIAGELGKFFTYAFSTANLTVHSGLPIERAHPQPPPPQPPLETDKVYLAFMCSEGENLSWGMDLRAIGFRNDDRKLVPKGFSLPGAMMDVCPAILQYYYNAATPNDMFFLDGCGLADHYNPAMYAIRLKPEHRPAVRRRFLDLTRIYMDRMGLGIIRPFDPTVSVRRAMLEEYVEAMPDLTAIFTGYNAEQGLPADAPNDFMIEGVPIFRTAVSSGPDSGDEANAALLVKGIRNATPDERPAFLNVFVLGNYVIHSSNVLKLVMDELGDDYVALRPDHFATMYRVTQSSPVSP